MTQGKSATVLKKILVGVDGSEKSILALKWAAKLADQTGAHLDVLTTWQTPFPTIELIALGLNFELTELNERPERIAHYRIEKSILGAYGKAYPSEVTSLVEEGYPGVILVERSKDVDLLVLGNRGHGQLLETLLGSVSIHCLSHAHCPVVIVKD